MVLGALAGGLVWVGELLTLRSRKALHRRRTQDWKPCRAWVSANGAHWEGYLPLSSEDKCQKHQIECDLCPGRKNGTKTVLAGI